MLYVLIFLLLILIPQIYYLVKKHNYNDIGNGKRFFIKEEVRLKDRTKLILTNSDGFCLYVNKFEVENPKAIIQIVHGMLEHSLNYLDFISYLNKYGYTVLIADNRGHGKSISENYPTGFIKESQELVDDQLMLNSYIKMIYPDSKIYMLGHSMGSLIARNYLKENDNTIDKLVLTGTVEYISIASIGIFLGNIVSFYLGEKRKSRFLDMLSGINSKDPSWISYNEENVKRKNNDPMRVRGFLARSNVCLFKLVKGLNEKKLYKLKNKNLKILSLNGIDDEVTGGKKGLEKTNKILNSIGYKNIEFKTYDKMKHEVLNEKNNNIVYEDIIDFFQN